jgi:predicted RecB family nuclease
MAEKWVKWLGQGRREMWDHVWPCHGAILPVDEVEAELLMQRCRGQFDYADPPELLKIKGIGPQVAAELMARGIETLEDLAIADSGPVQDKRLAGWAREARRILVSKASEQEE